jgi:hypothetical protein
MMKLYRTFSYFWLQKTLGDSKQILYKEKIKDNRELLTVIPKAVDKSVDNYVDNSCRCLSDLYSNRIAQNMGKDNYNNFNWL